MCVCVCLDGSFAFARPWAAGVLAPAGHDVRLTMCKRATHIDPRVIVSTWATAVEWAWNKGGSGEAKSVANPAMAR